MRRVRTSAPFGVDAVPATGGGENHRHAPDVSLECCDGACWARLSNLGRVTKFDITCGLSAAEANVFGSNLDKNHFDVLRRYSEWAQIAHYRLIELPLSIKRAP